MLVMVVFFIAFRWIHLSTPLIRLFLLVLILLLIPTLNFLPVWVALSLLRFLLTSRLPMRFIFWFQAEDGIRDYKGTGVQTCALPIFRCLLGHVETVLVAALARDPAVRAGVVTAQRHDKHVQAGEVREPVIARPRLQRQQLEWQLVRSEERRVGKEGRSRWSPYH